MAPRRVFGPHCYGFSANSAQAAPELAIRDFEIVMNNTMSIFSTKLPQLFVAIRFPDSFLPAYSAHDA
jgi:hypothetical protein